MVTSRPFRLPTGREGRFSLKHVGRSVALMTVRGQLSRDEQVLLPRWRRYGVTIKTRGGKATFPGKYGSHRTIHTGNLIQASPALYAYNGRKGNRPCCEDAKISGPRVLGRPGMWCWNPQGVLQICYL